MGASTLIASAFCGETSFSSLQYLARFYQRALQRLVAQQCTVTYGGYSHLIT